MKLLWTILILFSMSSYAAEPRDLFKELLIRGADLEPETIIITCDNSDAWCNGYFTAAIHMLEANNTKLCIPVNEHDRQIDDGVWAIVKSWLYRQPKDKKVTLYQAVSTALTEHNEC